VPFLTLPDVNYFFSPTTIIFTGFSYIIPQTHNCQGTAETLHTKKHGVTVTDLSICVVMSKSDTLSISSRTSGTFTARLWCGNVEEEKSF